MEPALMISEGTMPPVAPGSPCCMHERQIREVHTALVGRKLTFRVVAIVFMAALAWSMEIAIAV